MSAAPPTRLAAVVLALVLPGMLVAQRPESHTVKRGDTLWDLARTYLGDPFLWPEIYRLNTDVVEDPHWIYPGEVLRLVPGAGPVSAVPPTDTPPPPSLVGRTDSAAPPLAAAPAEVPPAEAAEPALGEPGLAEPEVGELGEEPRDSVDLTVLVGRGRRADFGPTLETNLERNFRPVRRSEFYSSGFLTERMPLPLGRYLGSVAPMQIEETTNRSVNVTFTRVAVTPPPGAQYQVGDTLLVVVLLREIPGYGQVVLPTGLVRVLDVSRPENLAEVIATYGPLRRGQQVLPAEKFPDPGNVRPVPISDGVRGEVIDSRDAQPLKGPQDVIFINRGRQDGVGLGDLFEIRLTPQARAEAATTVEEVIATMQVVHLGDRTATGRVVRVSQPRIEPGMEVRQIAKLPS